MTMLAKKTRESQNPVLSPEKNLPNVRQSKGKVMVITRPLSFELEVNVVSVALRGTSLKKIPHTGDTESLDRCG